MKNYLILNGVSSETISGLIIQSLPPISKPKIRAQVEEIDGRDGDIVTTLGYGAYDKEVSIGLSFDYDVDEVIKFFNSSGTVTFSNEEDKYYNYQILEQIDFERLLRFKQAKVKFHIQPFKYSYYDNLKTFNISSNTPIRINNMGNIYSRPILTITGTGNIAIYLNGSQMFQIALGDLGSITIDTNNMEAYKGSVLMNRIVAGNYDNFKMLVGSNTITWSGNITKIQIENFSRWI